MPGFDGTGPTGKGPRTGGGFGYCPPGPGASPGLLGVGRGGYPRGGGRGRAWGGGRGFLNRAYPPAAVGYNPYYAAGYTVPSAADELNFLKDNLSALEGEIEAVRNRIKELDVREKKNRPE